MRSLLLVVVSIAVARVAAASPESDKFFRDGKDLLKAGKLADACEAFAQSQKLEPRVGTLLNLADCRERQGQTATAWSLFRDAKVLASQTKDKREKEATTRAASLEPKLAYLTLTIAPVRQVDGLVIKRNGTVVDVAAWNQPVPLDPGDYVFEGSAPKYQPWSKKQPLAPRERVDVVVELVADPVTVAVVQPEPKQTPPDVLVSHPVDHGAPPSPLQDGPIPPLRPFGFGLTLGWRADTDDFLVGGRILGNVAVPHGALRGAASLIYTNTQLDRFHNDPTDPTNTTSIYEMGLSLDYVWMPVPQFAFAAGLGAGIDYFVVSLDQGTATDRWGALRASPLIVRLLDGHVELGVHLQLVANSTDVVFLGVAAIDVFPL